MYLRAAVVVCGLSAAGACILARPDVVIWKVGSPHQSTVVPPSEIPGDLRDIAAHRDVGLAIAAFPANGFQTEFRESRARESLPDLLVIDNMGILTGFPPQYGGYEGIAQDPEARKDFVRATGTFDSLLGPQSGWTYLHKHSPNHARAKRLALTRPACPDWTDWPAERAELVPIAKDIATAYLRGDRRRLRTIADDDRLETTPANSWQQARVDFVQPCGLVALDRLAFAWLQVVYETPSALGYKPLLIVLHKPEAQSQWRVLVIAQDPLSTSKSFLREVGLRTERILMTAPPQPATLLEPPSGVYPPAPQGERFGSFKWRRSFQPGTALEIVEFAYDDDARVLLSYGSAQPEVSTGRLWFTRTTWQWRVWTVNRTGDISFSERRSFPN